MTKIRTDAHGVYIRTGGYVFRPVQNRYSHMLGATDHGVTSFAPGEVVRARHIASPPRARVKANGREEIWHSHGCYYSDSDGSVIPSDQLWIVK